MSSTLDLDLLLTPGDVSDYLGIPKGTLANWRSAGRGSAYLRVGRHVRYRRSACRLDLVAHPGHGARDQRSVAWSQLLDGRSRDGRPPIPWRCGAGDGGAAVASIDRTNTGWRARWRTPEGASRSRNFRRKADAERFLTRIEASKLAGRTPVCVPAGGRARVHEPGAQAGEPELLNHHVWKPALRAAGVEPTRENGMHALRHFYASVQLEAGTSIRALAEYLGHADPGFTLRVYTHLMPSSEDRARQAADAVLAHALEAASRVNPVSRGGLPSA